MARILVILLSVLVAAECAIFRKRDHGDFSITEEDLCMIKLQQCFAPFMNFDMEHIERDIDDVCRKYDDVAPCLRAVKRECEDAVVGGIAEQSLSTGDYICSSEGKNLVKEFKQSSPCYDSAAHKRELGEKVQECVMQRINPFEHSDECGQFELMQECATEEAGELCGNAAEQLVSGVLRRLSQSDCTSRDRSVKRGLKELARLASGPMRRAAS